MPIEIEWAGVCQDIVENEDHVFSLMGLLLDGGALVGGLPAEGTLRIAIILGMDHDEAVVPRVVRTQIAVRAPDGRTVLETSMLYATTYREETRMTGTFPEHTIQPCILTLQFDQVGVYEIGLSIDGPEYLVHFEVFSPV